MQRVTITAGVGQDRDGNPLEPALLARIIPAIRKQLALTFEGFTEESTYGGWINPKGELVMEPSMRWVTVTDDEMPAGMVAQWIARMLKQDSVLVEIEPEIQAVFVKSDNVFEAFQRETVTNGATIH